MIKPKKKQKNDHSLSYILFASFLYKNTYFDFCRWFVLFGESHKFTELVQALTHRIEKASYYLTAQMN